MTVATSAAGSVTSAQSNSEHVGDWGSFVARFRKAAGVELLADLLGVTALFVALTGDQAWLALLLTGLAFAVAAGSAVPFLPEISRSVRPTGLVVLPRTLVVFAVAAAGSSDIAANPWETGAVAAALLTGVLVAEATIARVAQGAIPYTANFAGAWIRNKPLFNPAYIFPVNTVAVAVFAVLVVVDAPPMWLLFVAVSAAVATAASLLDGVLRIRSRRHAEWGITEALTSYEPVFAVHWDAPSGTEYQLAMWLPYLSRLDTKFFVIVRNQGTFERVAMLTDAPVLLRKEMADLDAMIVPSLKTVFYMNNAVRNSQFVRYPQLTHIQLNHGDSDKAPSYNPVSRMFHKNFVAGQAAIDRFASHGVHVPAEAFSIVGRPQVEGIAVGARTHGSNGAPTVLYAPTWGGYNADSDYSSLPIGHEIVRGLLARNCTIIYRPHPYTDRNPTHGAESARIKALLRQDSATSNRAHLWGEAAEVTLSITDCFNAVDALVSDVSSVVPDFLYSEKPFAMTSMTMPLHDFAAEFPIAKAGYLIDRSLDSLEASLDALVGADPLKAIRLDSKSYYLGDFPADSYADAFLDEARKFLR